MTSTHLVTGVTGQDGVLLSRHLLARGDRVVGTTRPGSDERDHMAPYLQGVEVVEHDLTDTQGFAALLDRHRPDTVVNLAGLTSVGRSWEQPELVMEVNGHAVERLLALLARHRDRGGADVRFLQAGSAEERADAAHSPYARAKAHARAATERARDDGLHAAVVTFFNHESPLRPATFVTRKITRTAAAIALGRAERLELGNLDVVRDWGSAREYVAALPLVLDLPEPRDLVLGTGVPHALTDLLAVAFDAAGLGDWERHVTSSVAHRRPADSAVLAAAADDLDATEQAIGWRARTTFEEVVTEMVRVDLRRLETGVEEAADYL